MVRGDRHDGYREIHDAGSGVPVSWSASELDRGGLLDVYVWSEAKRLVMLAAGLQDHVKKASSGTFLVNAEPGVYYLEVRGTGVKWHVAVERKKS
jgi:hypothetical protein